MKLRVETSLDPTILDLPATELLTVLDGPTLFDLTQPGQAPMFVSVLLHGNEVSGWDAVRSILKEQQHNGHGTSMLLLVGNVLAASQGVRALDGQTDFNRIWEEEKGKKFPWAEEVIERVSFRKPWFALDIHNNTCPNPHHAVITDMNPSTLSAARRFSKTAIFAMQPLSILSRRCSQFCTAITLEVGVPSDPNSADRARAFLKYLVDLGAVPATHSDDLEIYTNKIRVVIENAQDLDESQVPNFTPSLSDWNFKTLDKGTEIAQLKTGGGRLLAQDERLNDVTHSYLEYKDDSVCLNSDVIMSMYTDNPRIALQDCVCYFLEPWM